MTMLAILRVVATRREEVLTAVCPFLWNSFVEHHRPNEEIVKTFIVGVCNQGVIIVVKSGANADTRLARDEGTSSLALDKTQ